MIVFLDRQGAYSVNLLSPTVSLTDVTNIYLATDRQSPARDLLLRFNLLDKDGKPIAEKQPIQGSAIYPDGTKAPLPIPTTLTPDANGNYEIRFNAARVYPPILNQAGRFIFIINAGSADDSSVERIPIASVRLLVDMGRAPFIDAIKPETITCSVGQPAPITVAIGDYALARADSLNVRVFGDSSDVSLNATTPGVFTGDLAHVCKVPLEKLACSTESTAVFHVRIVAQLTDGSVLPAVERDLPAKVVALRCTPTPTPKPPPTPIPDTDKDGLKDPVDQCPTEAGWEIFGGCPPPLWFWGGIALFAILAVIAIAKWGAPWVIVNYISPPPKAFVVICVSGKPGGGSSPIFKSIDNVGREKLKNNNITIGSAEKVDIQIKGFLPLEFTVEKQGDKVMLIKEGAASSKQFLDIVQSETSKSGMKIYFSVDKPAMQKQKC